MTAETLAPQQQPVQVTAVLAPPAQQPMQIALPPSEAPTKAPPEVNSNAPGLMRVRYVLDEYPGEIKRSILDSFEGVEGADGDAPRPPAPANKVPDKIASGLFSALKAAEDTGKAINGEAEMGFQPPPFAPAGGPAFGAAPFDTMSKEERRNLMREKFREAIERASALNQ